MVQTLGVGNSTSVDESKETLLLFFDAREAGLANALQ